MAEAVAQIPAPVVAFLQLPRLVQLTTLDAETGGPFVNTLSWVVALGPGTIRLAGDARTRFIRNLAADGRVALTVLGAGNAWTIYGQAAVLGETEPLGPLRPMLVEVTGLQAFESLFFGARLTREPAWEATGSPAEAKRLDAAVFKLLREFPLPARA